jgi:hypothetical protein
MTATEADVIRTNLLRAQHWMEKRPTSELRNRIAVRHITDALAVVNAYSGSPEGRMVPDGARAGVVPRPASTEDAA